MSPLMPVADLAARLEDRDLRVADCRWYLGEPARGREAYGAGRVPGAVYVDLERDLSAATGPGRHPLPDPEVFAMRMGALGIGNEHTVVAYDDRGGAVAARLWWLLRSVGHAGAFVLDGGLTAWLAAGRPLTTAGATPEPVEFAVTRTAGLTIDRDELRRRLGEVVLVDARSAERYRGDEEPIDPVAGHIPTAVNVPYEGNLGDDLRFLDAAALAERYRAAGVSAGADVVAYCGSGVTACHDLLALEVAGFDNARLYPGSWSDWSTAGYRVATGRWPGSG